MEISRARTPPSALRAATSPRNRGENGAASTAQPHPLRTVRRASARWRLGGVSARPDRHHKIYAVGTGTHGDPRIGANPPAGPPLVQPHPCRGARCARRAVGDGGGVKVLRALLRDRRDLGRPASARLHRDPAARGRGGAQPGAVLAGATRRNRQLERSADALADRKRDLAPQRTRRARSGSAGLGCRAVPRARIAARALEHRA